MDETLRPIIDLRFDESSEYIGVVGPRSVRIHKMNQSSHFFDLDVNGDNLVGLRFLQGKPWVATATGKLLSYKKPEMEAAATGTETDAAAAETEAMEGEDKS